jgi:hypothetical protein
VFVPLLLLKLVELFKLFAESVVLLLVLVLLWWCLDFAANESDVNSVDAVIATAKTITIASAFVFRFH